MTDHTDNPFWAVQEDIRVAVNDYYYARRELDSPGLTDEEFEKRYAVFSQCVDKLGRAILNYGRTSKE